MQHPLEYYQKNSENAQAALAQFKKQLAISSTIRLIVFLLGAVGVYFALGNAQAIILIVLATVILFVFLISRHSDLQYKRDYQQAILDQNQTEIRVLNRDYYDLPSGENFKLDNHFYSQDIDLFGTGSFYQYVNRTSLESGAAKLANYLTENMIEAIPEKQEAVQELREKATWRQHFSATASLVKTEISAAAIITWLKEYQPFAPKWAKTVSWIFSGLSLVVIALAFLGIVPEFVVVFWFFLGLGISGRYIKKVNLLADMTGKAQSTFQQYHKLLEAIGEEAFTSSYLKAQSKKITDGHEQTASSVIKRFSKILSAFDQRNNMLVGAVINGFFLADLRNSYNIEKWISAEAASVETWFHVIAFFDAFNTLGNFAFNHPDYVFPEIKAQSGVLEVKNASHPLLDPKKAVTNDFSIQNGEFFIVTGANMAGKSTFLRTVSLQILMANIGLPVCATKSAYNPIKLITSMRTSDSLTEESSYFFAELKRLQFIVEAIKEDSYFIVLDEILKGTNSTDKAIGSRKFVEKLVASNSTGIIATHDLSLCETADVLPAVKNYYFDAQIQDGELFFDYTLKEGICQNMNASFLLQKMGIV